MHVLLEFLRVTSELAKKKTLVLQIYKNISRYMKSPE